MNKKHFGEAILATLVVGTPALEFLKNHKEDHFDIHTEIECALPNPGIGINAYNIVKMPLTSGKTSAQLVTMLDTQP